MNTWLINYFIKKNEKRKNFEDLSQRQKERRRKEFFELVEWAGKFLKMRRGYGGYLD